MDGWGTAGGDHPLRLVSTKGIGTSSMLCLHIAELPTSLGHGHGLKTRKYFTN